MDNARLLDIAESAIHSARLEKLEGVSISRDSYEDGSVRVTIDLNFLPVKEEKAKS